MISPVEINYFTPEFCVMEKKKRGYIGVEQALPKIRQFCSYQERCHAEVKEKLFEFGLYPEQVEEIIAGLISDNYLNEERFAIHYAGGKFRMKGWGKNKISYALKQKQVSAFLVKQALSAIDEQQYESVFLETAQKKWDSLKGEKNIFTKKSKTRNYLMQRGFESFLIQDFLNEK